MKNMRDKRLDILFEPLAMTNLTLKNRFFMAPIGTTFNMSQLRDMWVARAKGEVGLVTTGLVSVHPSGHAIASSELSLETDDDILVFSPVVKAVQNAGAKIIAQLSHAGRYTSGKLTGEQSLAPSPIASRYTGETPRELSTREVDDLVVAFAEAALRARKAGFDGIELAGGSGYLISQFLSPVTNERVDKYGGDALKRTTFLTSILQETRSRVGEDFNVCVKFDAEDGMKGGKTLEDSLMIAPIIVDAGADRLHVWAGWHEATRPMLPSWVPPGAFSYLAAAIKKVVDVPVSTVGRINDPYVAADILAKGEADLIGLGRTLLCDPDFVKKTMEGRLSDIRRCIACCICFDQVSMAVRGKENAEVKCALNPEMGHEGEALIQPAKQKKHVVVVGAGPAGLEASRVAAVRGHDVTLFEEDDKVGGMVNLASIPPHKEELKNIANYYTSQMEGLQVKLRLNETFTKEKLDEIKPDVVVLSTGAKEFVPAIPGIKDEKVVSALEVLNGLADVGNEAVVIGGGLIGLETAEFLAEQGTKVTVVEMLKHLASDVGPTTRWGMLQRIKEKMEILAATKVLSIEDGRVVVEDQENIRTDIPADTIVVATGLSSRADLVPVLEESNVEFYIIGSCHQPGQIEAAVADGFAVGCRV